jgi:hypothetical protein
MDDPEQFCVGILPSGGLARSGARGYMARPTLVGGFPSCRSADHLRKHSNRFQIVVLIEAVDLLHQRLRIRG